MPACGHNTDDNDQHPATSSQHPAPSNRTLWAASALAFTLAALVIRQGRLYLIEKELSPGQNLGSPDYENSSAAPVRYSTGKNTHI